MVFISTFHYFFQSHILRLQNGIHYIQYNVTLIRKRFCFLPVVILVTVGVVCLVAAILMVVWRRNSEFEFDSL